MIRLQSGSQVHQLLTLLSVACEYPTGSLAILGNERVIKRLIHKLESSQEIRRESSGELYIGKTLQVSGIRDRRTVRFYRGGLELLSELHPGAFDYYMDATRSHRFPGDAQHIWRNHRVGEALAMMMAAGIEMRPYVLPRLQMADIRLTVPDSPSYYTARVIKEHIPQDSRKKKQYTRGVGLLFYPGGCYAVYNTREAVMKWNSGGEFKMKQDMIEIARKNAGLQESSSAILFGGGPDTALNTIIESDKSRNMEQRFDRLYHNIHFVPLNQDGVKLLRLLVIPDWHERLLDAWFTQDQRSYNRGHMEYDALKDGTYILSHLDSDIARLMRFNAALQSQTAQFEVRCYPWQVPFLEEYLENRVSIKTLEIDTVLAAFGL